LSIANFRHYNKPMTRIILTLGLLLIVVSSLTLFIIALLPKDQPEITRVLMPRDRCPLDCELGIRPGVTRFNDALALLEAHPWIGQVKSNGQAVAWTWSGSQPALINENMAGSLTLDAQGKVVTELRFQTRIEVGSAWLLFGLPQMGGLSDYDPYTAHIASYLDRGITITNRLRCPVSAYTFWHTPVEITFYQPVTKSIARQYDLPSRFDQFYCEP
jgi:hypothetical protein